MLSDIKISGSGNISGGEYNNVRVSGSGDIMGDITCNEIKISGSSDCNGVIRAKSCTISGSADCMKDIFIEEELKISGSTDIHGNVEGKNIRISGGTDIDGNIKCENIDVSGSCDIGGNVSFDYMSVSGSTDVKGNCEGREFHSKSAGDINGLLAADIIDISLAGTMNIGEIGGEKISIKDYSKKVFIGFSLFSREARLITESIEGDVIDIENTRCKVIRGENINIGKNCEIDKVEYTGKLNIDSSSTVKEVIEIKKENN